MTAASRRYPAGYCGLPPRAGNLKNLDEFDMGSNMTLLCAFWIFREDHTRKYLKRMLFPTALFTLGAMLHAFEIPSKWHLKLYSLECAWSSHDNLTMCGSVTLGSRTVRHVRQLSDFQQGRSYTNGQGGNHSQLFGCSNKSGIPDVVYWKVTVCSFCRALRARKIHPACFGQFL